MVKLISNIRKNIAKSNLERRKMNEEVRKARNKARQRERIKVAQQIEKAKARERLAKRIARRELALAKRSGSKVNFRRVLAGNKSPSSGNKRVVTIKGKKYRLKPITKKKTKRRKRTQSNGFNFY